GDGLAEPHEFSQHLGPPHNRKQSLARGDILGIVRPDGTGDDHDLSLAEVFRRMADKGANPLFAQAHHVRVLRLVRALHAVAERMQRFGNAAHADAADADEMHDPDRMRHFHEVTLLFQSSAERPAAIASVKSASTTVASVRAMLFAPAAMAARRSPS